MKSFTPQPSWTRQAGATTKVNRSRVNSLPSFSLCPVFPILSLGYVSVILCLALLHNDTLVSLELRANGLFPACTRGSAMPPDTDGLFIASRHSRHRMKTLSPPSRLFSRHSKAFCAPALSARARTEARGAAESLCALLRVYLYDATSKRWLPGDSEDE